MCRKVGFHDNTLWQKFSFAIFAVNSFTIFITLNYALISRNEAIDLWYVFDEKLKEYLKTHYAILAFGGSKQYMLFIFLTFIMIIFINIGVHYFIIFKSMLKFIRQLQEHNRQAIVKNNYITQMCYHVIKSTLPILFLYLPLLYTVIVFLFFYDKKYYWFTEPTTNTIPFFIIIYAITSALYVLLFKYIILKRQKKNVVKIISLKTQSITKK